MPEVMHADPAKVGRARSIRVHRALPSLVRDPLKALVDFGDQANGDVVRLNLGTFRPYLVTNPVHVQHILRDNVANYERAGDGLFWRPIRRLYGEGILGEGQLWETSRKILQPLFTAKRVDAMGHGMAEAIGAAVDELGQPSPQGRTIDLGRELTRIVSQTTMRVLFANKVPLSGALRIVAAQGTMATAVLPRIAVPFAPLSLPMPGDRAFRNAAQIVDDVLLPVVREARCQSEDGDDIISALCRARTADGRQLDERQVRNDTAAMFATATETTTHLLTWLWPHLHAHPEVAVRLQDEVDRVVGTDQVGPQHLSELRYTKMVLDELLRLYPIGWLFPRRAKAADVVGGVRIDAGATIVLSPFITQRATAYWDRPDQFDPERFSPENVRRRHRYAHFPFGGGPHTCLGMYLFYVEAQLIVATMLTRFRFRLTDQVVPAPRLAASLRPRGKVELTLLPRQHTSGSEERGAFA